MSLDNILGTIPKSKEIHADYKFTGSSFSNITQTENDIAYNSRISDSTYYVSLTQEYFVPLSSIRNQVFGAEEIINKTKVGIEDAFLRKIFINAYVDSDLQEAHLKVWKEACKFLNIPNTTTNNISATVMPYEGQIVDSETKKIIGKDTPPGYICFDEYVFAENYMSTASRRLISDFDRLVAHSTFSYFFQIRKLLNYFLTEIFNIKNSLLFDFGETYENESQQKIALRYDTWSKMALHYTRRIASTIIAQPDKIPNAEVDKISKKQAAQFQAFFAIRLNAVDSEINDILSILKRDLGEDSEVFYKRYVSGALRFNKGIVEPLDLDYNTTSFSRDFPFLGSELVVATSVLQGNFSAVHADIIERYENFITKVDALMSLIHEKRRFASYISQLADIAVQKRKIIETVADDKYASLFRSIIITDAAKSKFDSGHGNLDDLEEDHHPQYLLKSGGVITGDISIAGNVKVGGISIADHEHNGMDGSNRISPASIDYESIRNSGNIDNYVSKPKSVTIDGFVSDVIDGGVPVFDTIINIEIDDEIANNYEFELIYTEIEQ